MNERLSAVKPSSIVRSWACHASQTELSTAAKAVVLASARRGLDLFAGTPIGASFGSTITFTPWKAACHLPPLRTQTVAARLGLGILLASPFGPAHVPSYFAR